MSISQKKNNFILVSTNHGLMIINRHDQIIFNNEKQEEIGYGVGYDLLERSIFNPHEINLGFLFLETARKKNGDGVVAVDCGANLGVHTLEWANFLSGWGKVISIEAQEKIYYALAGNIILNNNLNVKALNVAVGDSVKKIQIPSPNYSLKSSFGSFELLKRNEREFIGQEIDFENLHEIDQISIDSLNLDRLDFMKIDVEGMEEDVLVGAEESISKFKPYLMIEFIKSDKDKLKNKLTLMGYKVLEAGLNLACGPIDDPVMDFIEKQIQEQKKS
jgi:FkbM family methyltransferase